MDFALTEEQDELRGLAAQILTGRATPARVEEVEAGAERFDRPLWAELAKAGLLGVGLPEDAGGLGMDLVATALVAEELGRVVAPVPLVWTTAAALTLAAHGSDEQRQRWLPAVCAGEAVLTTVLPDGATGVRRDGDRLSGTLAAVPYAHVVDAVLVPVGAEVVLLDPAADGVTVRSGEATSRELHGWLELADVPVQPVGTAAAEWLWQRTAVLLAAVQSGVTAAALRLAADYTSTRKQFGKPLSTFQGVAHKAADAYIDNAAIRATMLQAAWRLDRGEAAEAEVLTAAWWASVAGQHAVHQTQHVHGGIGADTTYPVHRYFLWGKQIELMLGGGSALLARLGEVLDALPAPGDELVIPGHETVAVAG